jgi:hypothetical protein
MALVNRRQGQNNDMHVRKQQNNDKRQDDHSPGLAQACEIAKFFYHLHLRQISSQNSTSGNQANADQIWTNGNQGIVDLFTCKITG